MVVRNDDGEETWNGLALPVMFSAPVMPDVVAAESRSMFNVVRLGRYHAKPAKMPLNHSKVPSSPPQPHPLLSPDRIETTPQ
jgi:hypothetical protein